MTETPAPRNSASSPRKGIDGRFRLSSFSDHLGLKTAAVFLAVVLWFVVNAKEPDIELIPIRFTPVLDSSLVLRDPLPPVQAIVVGPPRELLKLNAARPTIRREIAANSPDTVMIDLRPEDVILPPNVDAVVREIEPRSIMLRFEPTVTRRVSVHSAVDVTTVPGMAIPDISARVDPPSVELVGPRNAVSRIPFVRTVKTAILFPDSLPHLVDIDTLSLAPGVRVRPAQVKVTLISNDGTRR